MEVLTLGLQLIMSILTAIMAGLVSRYMDKAKKLSEKQQAEHEKILAIQKTENEAIRAGLRSILRNEIIKICRECLEKGSVPLHRDEQISKLYQAYHDLGGNGSVTRIVQEALELPHE